MADMTESPPLFDTNETKLDDLEDDDEDIFASAVQVYSSMTLDRAGSQNFTSKKGKKILKFFPDELA